MAAVFVTGTDTGIGKTTVSTALLTAFREAGFSVAGIKPIASGCSRVEGELRNEDAMLLQAASSIELAYVDVNPYAFEPPIAPNVAADLAGAVLDIEFLVRHCRRLESRVDLLVVEGVGGLEVPLNDMLTIKHLAEALRYPVIMVVGMRLGCLNHAILTDRAIRTSGTPYFGWVANHVDPGFAHSEENLLTLKRFISSPLLATIPYKSVLDTIESGGFIDVGTFEPLLRCVR